VTYEGPRPLFLGNPTEEDQIEDVAWDMVRQKSLAIDALSLKMANCTSVM